MKSLKTLLLASTVLAFAAPYAKAADLPMPVEPPVVIEPVIHTDSAFYLRGDIGYTIFDDPSVYTQKGEEYSYTEWDDTWLIGLGIGYKFNDYFRTDVTFDYRFQSDFYGRLTCPCGGDSQEYSDGDAWTLLANAYIDFAHLEKFTPYIGAGVGVGQVKFGDLNVTNWDGSKGVIPGSKDEVGFAAAAMFGFSYHISENLAVDAGYRFLWLPDTKTKQNAYHEYVSYEDLTAHEIRIGLRYYFGDM